MKTQKEWNNILILKKEAKQKKPLRSSFTFFPIRKTYPGTYC